MVIIRAMNGNPIPMNAIRAQVDEHPYYVDNKDDKRYMVLYDEDYVEHGVDMAGNVAILLNKENAKEVKRLAEEIIEDLE